MSGTSRSSTEDTLDAALYYISEYEWPLFLCHRNKQPFGGTHGFKDATTDARKIEKLLRQNPGANIASPAGMEWDVLDVDGFEAAERLLEYGRLPSTVEQRTPSGPGRLHYFLRHHEGVTNARGGLPRGIDVRGEGGYVLLPPSRLSNGASYEWITSPDDSDCAEWPGWLLDLLRPGRNGDEASSLEDWEPLDVDAIFEGVPKGERDETAYKYACSLIGRDVPKKEALALMKLAWDQMEQPARDEYPRDLCLEKVHRAYRTFKPNSQKSALVIETADLEKARPTEWAWHHTLAIGYLNLLLGQEGIGKGTFVSWVLARLTRGELAGVFKDKPIHVAVIGDEDDFNNQWAPRLNAAGADLALVHGIRRPNFGSIELGDDRERIAASIREFDIRVLYLDQLLDHLGLKTDDWRSKQVREALIPARSLAREFDIAVWAALHPNKRGGSYRELVSGAVAFNAVGKSNFLLARHPDDPERRVFVHGKGNYAPPPLAIEFYLDGFCVDTENGVLEGPMVDRGSITKSNLTTEQLIEAENAKHRSASADPNSKSGQARQLIIEMLPNDGRWHLAQPIVDAGEDEGISKSIISQQRKRLGILSERKSEHQARAVWKWSIHVKTGQRSG